MEVRSTPAEGLCARRAFGWAASWAIALILLLFGAASALAADTSREDRIKAAIVYKVGKFVEWPDSAFSGADAPLQLCLLGKDGFASALSTVAGRRVQGREVDFKVVPTASATQLGDCHILFLPRSSAGRAAGALRTVGGRPVLTISDIPGFARSGGMISLVRSGNRIGFEIDPAAASTSGLAVRAQLLDLARIVER